MRQSIIHTCFTSLFVITTCFQLGCSAPKRYYPDDDAGVTGGNSSVGGSDASGGSSLGGGNSATVGGNSTGTSSTIAGTAGTGGAVATGGTSAIATVTASAGAVNTGGGGSSTATGDSAALGGASGSTGGASASTNACSKDADCVNSDPINCSYTCVNPGTAGTCKAAVLTENSRCLTSECVDRAISGFWDASGKPYVAYGFTEADGSASIRMQALKPDGMVDGEAVRYRLPADYMEPTVLSTNALGADVGILWLSQTRDISGSIGSVVAFALTDPAASKSTSNEVERNGAGAKRAAQGLWLQTTSTQTWLAVENWAVSGIANGLTASSGSIIGAWTSLSPAVFSGEGFGILGETLMLVGPDCNGCAPLKLQRYDVANMLPIGSFITLSATRGPVVAMGPVSGSMALLWADGNSPGQIFRALLDEDGTFSLPVGAVQSAIQPKTVFQSPDGGALLVGTIITANANGAAYQLVSQRLDANLNLIGNPLVLADSQIEDANTFESRPSSDGKQVLLTYHQAGARYRLLSTVACP